MYVQHTIKVIKSMLYSLSIIFIYIYALWHMRSEVRCGIRFVYVHAFLASAVGLGLKALACYFSRPELSREDTINKPRIG